MYKIILFGAYGEANLGDDALLVANVHLLTSIFPRGEIAVHCRDAQYLETMLPGVKVIPSDLPVQLKADFAVHGGGTTFFSFPLSFAATGFLAKVLHCLLAPRVSSRKLWRKFSKKKWEFKYRAALGIGLGPFGPDSKTESYACATVRSFDFVGLRDLVSFRLARDSWKCDNTTLGADVCYCPELLGLNREPRSSRQQPAGRIGVVIRDWVHSEEGQAYVQPLRSAVATLRGSGLSVRYISFCHDGDRQWLQMLEADRDPALVWDPSQHSLPDFVSALADYDLIVTARYHGAVLPSVLGVPVIVVGLEQKLREASNELLGSACLWDPPFSPRDLCDKAAAILADYQGTCEALQAAVTARTDAARSLMRDYLEFIEEKSATSRRSGDAS